MSNSIQLTVKMFGAFRKYGHGVMSLNLPQESTAKSAKLAMGNLLRNAYPTFDEDELINKSVLADNQRVLLDDEIITDNQSLALLPPVCGG